MFTGTCTSLTGSNDSGGKPETTPRAHPGWFHRCRHTGQLQWVPAAVEREGAQASPSAGGLSNTDQSREHQSGRGGAAGPPDAPG